MPMATAAGVSYGIRSTSPISCDAAYAAAAARVRSSMATPAVIVPKPAVGWLPGGGSAGIDLSRARMRRASSTHIAATTYQIQRITPPQPRSYSGRVLPCRRRILEFAERLRVPRDGFAQSLFHRVAGGPPE